MTRDFTVAVFVIHRHHLVFHWHAKLRRWLPPGGHIEPDELPDEAAVREVREETGLEVRLAGRPGIDVSGPGQPLQMIRPEGIQLEDIGPGHQHIDLIYFARLAEMDSGFPALVEGAHWMDTDAIVGLGLTPELLAWCLRALGVDEAGA